MSRLEDFLKRIQRRRCQKINKEVSVGFIKDSLIDNIYSMHLGPYQEIVDVDIPGLTTGLVNITLYVKKEAKARG